MQAVKSTAWAYGVELVRTGPTVITGSYFFDNLGGTAVVEDGVFIAAGEEHGAFFAVKHGPMVGVGVAAAAFPGHGFVALKVQEMTWVSGVSQSSR
jgi:hypothetical protein